MRGEVSGTIDRSTGATSHLRGALPLEPRYAASSRDSDWSEEPADHAFDPTPRRGGRSDSGESEDSWILAQLDGLGTELGADDEATPDPPAAPARRPAVPPITRDVWGSPSPYLEERLGAATRAVSGVGQQVRELADRTEELQRTIETLEQELNRAAQEVSYIRENGLEGEGTPKLAAIADETGASRAPARCRSVRTGAPPPVTPPAPERRYEGFTAARYNSTMGGLQSRRRRVAAAMLLIAASISFVLVLVAYAAHEATPPLWLAVLPGIWMIPVPFFALSFRGTHRILGGHTFRLPGEP